MRLSIITSALLLVGYAVALPAVTPFSEADMAPLYTPLNGETVAMSYIVVLKNHLNEKETNEHTAWITQFTTGTKGGNTWSQWLHPNSASHGVRHVYNLPSFKGYSGKFRPEIIDLIRSSNDVLYVEQDSIVYVNELQRSAPWGLARVSHRGKLSLNTFNKYEYDETTAGEGIKVYVIDTGINVDHVDFEGRATWGATIPDGEDNEDGNGHGSHCAGTIAGRKYGVAKKAEPIAIKAVHANGSGATSDIIRAVEWVAISHTNEVTAAKQSGKAVKLSVANMSLGVLNSRSLNAAVNNAVDTGIVFAVAAGNENADACSMSPAAAEKAITVGASTISDERASFSNYGKCVDVFAPGLNVESIWRGSRYATAIGSGTSMASPHVAGLAAYLLSQEQETVTPKQIKEKILALSTRDALTDVGKDSPNLLIYNGYSKGSNIKSLFQGTLTSYNNGY